MQAKSLTFVSQLAARLNFQSGSLKIFWIFRPQTGKPEKKEGEENQPIGLMPRYYRFDRIKDMEKLAYFYKRENWEMVIAKTKATTSLWRRRLTDMYNRSFECDQTRK